MLYLVDGFTDCSEFFLDPLVMLIDRAERSSFRHNIVPNLWAHFVLPNIEVEQELSSYEPCFIVSFGSRGALHDSNGDFLYSPLPLPFDEYGTSTITFLG